MNRSEFISKLMEVLPDEDPEILLTGDGKGDEEVDGYYWLETFLQLTSDKIKGKNYIIMSVD